jgi:flagellar biosynthesis protein FlhG
MLDQATRLRELVHEQSDGSPRPRLLTVTSGKGGVGKSTVALNTALAMSDLGKRVLIVDADANLGNIDVMLGLSPKYRLSHVLRGERDIEDVLLTVNSRLKILPGASGETDYPILNAESQASLMKDICSLEEIFDFVVIDTAAGLTPEIIGFAVNADDVLVVTRPEPTAVMDAYAVIKVVSQTKSEVSMNVLFNGAHTPAEADEAAQKLQKAVRHFLNIRVPYIGSIPFDSRAAEAAVEQNPVVRRFPTSGASLSFQSLAQRLAYPSFRMQSQEVLHE